MYADSRVAERIALAEAELSFPLTYRSVAEVIAFDQRLLAESKYEMDQFGLPRATRHLSAADSRWILNEQALVTCDAAYFLTRYCFLRTENGIIQRFRFRVPQRIFFDIICDLEERGFSIEILALKARQLGVSLFAELLNSHRVFFFSGVGAVIGSADHTKTGEMSRMMTLCYDYLPCWLRPEATTRQESGTGGKLIFGGIASSVSFQHGSQKFGIATGSTPISYHLCIGEETRVRVADGDIKRVCDLTTSDRVIAPSGQLVAVKAVTRSPRADPDMVRIDMCLSPFPLLLTEDHQVSTSAGVKPAGKITSQDWLVYPLRHLYDPQQPLQIKNYTKWAGVYGRPVNATVADIEPSYDVGWMAGLYLAEGCVGMTTSRKRPADVMFAMHRDEEPLFRERLESVPLVTLRKTEFRRTAKTAILTMNHRGWTEWLHVYFGNKSTKRVPDNCWNWGREFCQGLVDGYLAGDGHAVDRLDSIYATSIRPAISFGIRELIASLGHGWSAIYFRKAGRNYGRNCKDTYTLAAAGNTARSLLGKPGKDYPRSLSNCRHRIEDGRVLIRVKRTLRVPSTKFYDVEVDHPSHYYAVVDGLVANSEVALYGEAATMLIDEGLWKAVHASPRVLGILESTGRSNIGWWAKTWYYSKANWPNARMYPMFLPWFVGVDIYPTETDRITRPVPPAWRPDRDTREHVAKAELYVASSPLLRKHLLAEQERRGVAPVDGVWRMPLDQQWYWEWNHEEAKYKGAESSFLQEMAGDDEEALQRSTESVFGHAAMAMIESHRARSYTAYGITGQSIEDAHEPDPADIDYARTRLPVRYASPRGEVYRWELIPLLFDGYTGDPAARLPLSPTKPDDAAGKLIVWHHPQPSVSYSIGVDTSEGKGLDATVISVWTAGRKGDPDIQCAEFASPYVNHVEAFSFILAIAAYYGQHMRVGETRWREPYVSIEQIAAVGDTAQHQMRKMGYSNFHRFKRYDNKHVSNARSNKMGWFTNVWSRPLLTGNFVACAQNSWATINSPWLVEEMRTFEVVVTASGREKMQHESGSHDDRIFAAAMAIFCPHDMDVLADRSKKRMTEVATQPPLDLAPVRGMTVPWSDLAQKSIATLDDILYADRGLDKYR